MAIVAVAIRILLHCSESAGTRGEGWEDETPRKYYNKQKTERKKTKKKEKRKKKRNKDLRVRRLPAPREQTERHQYFSWERRCFLKLGITERPRDAVGSGVIAGTRSVNSDRYKNEADAECLRTKFQSPRSTCGRDLMEEAADSYNLAAVGWTRCHSKSPVAAFAQLRLFNWGRHRLTALNGQREAHHQPNGHCARAGCQVQSVASGW